MSFNEAYVVGLGLQFKFYGLKVCELEQDLANLDLEVNVGIK